MNGEMHIPSLGMISFPSSTIAEINLFFNKSEATQA
jgi:hypothetical protein